MTLEDAEWIAARQFSVEEVARLFRVPPTVIGDLRNGNYSNSVEMARQFVTHGHFRVNGQKVKMSNVELPVLFTLRLLGPLSVFVGPAFALSDSSYYRIDGERREFGNAKPTLTYMAGAAVRLNHLVLDCRFNGAFNKTENYFEGVYPRIKSYQLLFSVGYAF